MDVKGHQLSPSSLLRSSYTEAYRKARRVESPSKGRERRVQMEIG